MKIPPRKITIVKTHKYQRKYHPAKDTTLEFESEIIDFFHPHECSEKNNLLFKIFKRIAKRFPFLLKKIKTEKIYFGVLMGYKELYNKAPFFLLNATHKIIYLFDAWEPLQFEIIQTIKEFGINIVFFSSENALFFFKNKLPEVKCYWVPEGININNYKFYPPEEKDIDVLQFGRKYDRYHQDIVDDLKTQDIKYLYEQKKGEILFSTKNEFIEGLARTKISICFPSSITHPERSGSFSTMTRRYLESMAAKCLIVGILPKEMEKLFPYNPIITVDNNPTKQLLDILKNYESYQPLIEKNYNEVHEHHQWANRCRQIQLLIQNALLHIG